MRMPLRLVLIALAAACASPQSEAPVQGRDGLPRGSAQNPAQFQTASLWNQEPQSLFGNRRARDVGDILTVIVQVDDEVNMQNTMDARRINDEDFSVNGLFGVPEWAANTLPLGATLTPAVGIERERRAQGNGRLLRRETVTLELAAVVVDQLPNGHLVIDGEQRIRVNDEIRDLRVSGVVRPDDITRDNTISHEKIAAADILYSGQGQVSGVTKSRLGSRILDAVVPF